MSDIMVLVNGCGAMTGYDPDHSPVGPAEAVLKAVCARHGVTREQLLSSCRKAEVVWAKWSAMMALRDIGGWSLPRIGRLLRRDHTTVLAGLHRAHERMSIDADYRAAVANVQAKAVRMFGRNGHV